MSNVVPSLPHILYATRPTKDQVNTIFRLHIPIVLCSIYITNKFIAHPLELLKKFPVSSGLRVGKGFKFGFN